MSGGNLARSDEVSLLASRPMCPGPSNEMSRLSTAAPPAPAPAPAVSAVFRRMTGMAVLPMTCKHTREGGEKGG